jgi:multidrug efflux system membrane fusion protein
LASKNLFFFTIFIPQKNNSRGITLNTNVRLASLFTFVLLLWFGSGIFVTPASKEVKLTETPLTSIQVTTFSQEMFQPKVLLRANTKANRSVNVVAQVAGQISAVPVKEGAGVVEGQTICEVNAEDRYLRLSQSQANLKQAGIAYEGALKLKTGGYQSDLAISKAKAKLETARANLKRAQINVGHLQIKAPFDGIVETRPVEIGDYVVPGMICAVVVEIHPIKITALVNEKEVSKIKLGDEASVTINGLHSIGASVSYLAHQANTATRSYRLEALAENPDESILAGLSSRLEILTKSVPAHLIPASSVLLDDQGGMVVRVISEKNIVQSKPVSALGETENGMWVSGLPEKALVVTVGQNYIIDGEKVAPTFLSNVVER